MLFPTRSQKRFFLISALLIFVGITVWNFVRIDAHSHSASDTLTQFIPQTLLSLGLLLLITFSLRRFSDRQNHSSHS